MVKVLISDKLSPAAVEIFRTRGIEVDLKPGLTPAELRAIIGDYDGLAVRSATKVTKELLDVAPKLKVVGRAGGVAHLGRPDRGSRRYRADAAVDRVGTCHRAGRT